MTSTTTMNEVSTTVTGSSSGRFVRWLFLLLILSGIGVSGYLSYVKFSDVPMICVSNGAFDCGLVQNSPYSELLGVPIAYLGLATYLVILGLVVFQSRSSFLREHGTLLLFGVVFFAWIYSMYLVYIQAFVLRAFCNWCLAHEAIVTVMLVLVSIKLWNHLRSDEA